MTPKGSGQVINTAREKLGVYGVRKRYYSPVFRTLCVYVVLAAEKKQGILVCGQPLPNTLVGETQQGDELFSEWLAMTDKKTFRRTSSPETVKFPFPCGSFFFCSHGRWSLLCQRICHYGCFNRHFFPTLSFFPLGVDASPR